MTVGEIVFFVRPSAENHTWKELNSEIRKVLEHG
jgi:hypothetical protein